MSITECVTILNHVSDFVPSYSTEHEHYYKLNCLHDSLKTASESTCNFCWTGISGAISVSSVTSSWWSCSVNNLSTNSTIAVVTDRWVCLRSRRFIIYGSGVRPLLPSACFAKSTKYLKWKLLFIGFTIHVEICITLMYIFGLNPTILASVQSTDLWFLTCCCSPCKVRLRVHFWVYDTFPSLAVVEI